MRPASACAPRSFVFERFRAAREKHLCDQLLLVHRGPSTLNDLEQRERIKCASSFYVCTEHLRLRPISSSEIGAAVRAAIACTLRSFDFDRSRAAREKEMCEQLLHLNRAPSTSNDLEQRERSSCAGICCVCAPLLRLRTTSSSARGANVRAASACAPRSFDYDRS